jgi:hypothetical protein
VVLYLASYSRFPITRADAELLSTRYPLPSVEAVDCRGVYSASHCFADELFSRIGHDAQILNASGYVQRVMEAGRNTARPDWEKPVL